MTFKGDVILIAQVPHDDDFYHDSPIFSPFNHHSGMAKFHVVSKFITIHTIFVADTKPILK